MITDQAIEIDIYDAIIINRMRNGDRERVGKGKLAPCDPRVMYQIHGQKCRDTARIWINFAMFDARQ